MLSAAAVSLTESTCPRIRPILIPRWWLSAISVIERAEKAKEEYGAPGAKTYVDYKQLLKDKSIDAVLVLTHNSEHCRITVDALNAGKHVMCEKPMAMNYEEAKKMNRGAR